jgi:hypothetical protein
MSLHVGVAHAPPLHTADWQSEPAPQLAPLPHLPQLPPQSTSDSLPFFTLSMHVAGAHAPDMQSVDSQSDGPPHARPSAHFGHDPPPQSTSVSAPFFR